ncbi:MAG: RecQ family zinc-binding domain-containing protein, partial [Alistipes sp.]|nr:RecQ family zinc-binding domain-containing protein [Alistipes sp.]
DGLYASMPFNIHEFCRREKLYIGTVKAVMDLLEQNDYMTLTEEMENPAKVMFCVSRDDLYKIRVDRNDLDHIIRTILRLYNGIFGEFRSIDERQIAAISGYTEEKVKELLKRMWQMRIIRYIPANSSPMLFFNEERLPTKDLYIAPETYHHRKQLMQERFDNMVSYATQQTECRSVVIQRYFGDQEATPCGVCDICLEQRRRRKSDQSNIAATILHLLGKEPMTAREICREIKAEPELIASVIEQMQHEGKISASISGKLIINE